MNPIILVILIILLLGGIGTGPWWGYHQYGWGPSGGFGLIIVVLIILLLLGKL